MSTRCSGPSCCCAAASEANLCVTTAAQNCRSAHLDDRARSRRHALVEETNQPALVRTMKHGEFVAAPASSLGWKVPH